MIRQVKGCFPVRQTVSFAPTLFGGSIISFLLLGFMPVGAVELLLSTQPETFYFF